MLLKSDMENVRLLQRNVMDSVIIAVWILDQETMIELYRLEIGGIRTIMKALFYQDRKPWIFKNGGMEQ